MEKEYEQRKVTEIHKHRVNDRAQILRVAPELRDTPYVKAPLRCRLFMHKTITLGGVYAGPWVIMCPRCGKVWKEWAYGGGFDGPGFSRKFFGYGDPDRGGRVLAGPHDDFPLVWEKGRLDEGWLKKRYGHVPYPDPNDESGDVIITHQTLEESLLKDFEGIYRKS